MSLAHVSVCPHHNKCQTQTITITILPDLPILEFRHHSPPMSTATTTTTSAAAAAAASPDIHLPASILAVIPSDPYDQLDLARRITAMAIASRVSSLESDASCMRRTIADQDALIFDLQNRLERMETNVQDSDARLRAVLEDNVKLTKEREMLGLTAKKLSRDLVKLETFKRHLLQSFNDEDASQEVEADNLGSQDHLASSSPSWKVTEDEPSISRTVSDAASGSTDGGDSSQDDRPFLPKLSSTPYATPRLTPTSRPKGSSLGGTPRGSSPRFLSGTSPKFLSGSKSPNGSSFKGRNSMSSWYPSSQQPSATSSPPQERSSTGRSRIDGKEFFRQARVRLSYEQFAAFLANVKELNAKTQSREETLEKADEIFGSENKDLYMSFQGLLSRS